MGAKGVGLGSTTVTKASLGLGNIDNVSDALKPVSAATQTALDLKVNTSLTIAGKPLTSNISLVKADVGLGNVANIALSGWGNIGNNLQATILSLKVRVLTIDGVSVTVLTID